MIKITIMIIILLIIIYTDSFGFPSSYCYYSITLNDVVRDWTH